MSTEPNTRKDKRIKYVVPSHHDRAETRHPTFVAARRAARELVAEGYPATVVEVATGDVHWSPSDDDFKEGTPT